MGKKLLDQVTLIIGGSGDLGKAIARAFNQEGAKITLAARKMEKLEKAATEVAPPTPHIIQGDITREEDVKGMIDATVKEWGRLDILINTAGVASLGPIEEATLADWNQTMDVNARGTFLACREAVKQMLKQKGHSQIINVVSYQGIDSRPNVGVYGASKHAVMGLTRSLAQEVQSRGIRVTALCPMPVRTQMRQALDPQKDLSTYLDPQEIAAAAVYMATRSFLGGIRELVVGLDRKLGGLS